MKVLRIEFICKRGVKTMCFCRPPRVLNNNCTVIVPAIPIGQAGIPMNGGVMPNMMPNAAMPNMMPNAAMPNMMPNATMPNMMPNATMPNMMPNAAMPNMMPSGAPSGFTCNANFETVQQIMEPPLQCPATTIHHHNRVQHLVPCIKTNIHHMHNHHEWLPFEQEERNQVVNHNHGVRPPDITLCNSVR